MRTRPTLHEAKDEAEVRYYEAEAKNIGLVIVIDNRDVESSLVVPMRTTVNQVAILSILS